MGEVAEKIQKMGVVPVVVLNDAKDAAPLAKALCEGGLPCAEVTFRTDHDNRVSRDVCRSRYGADDRSG